MTRHGMAAAVVASALWLGAITAANADEPVQRFEKDVVEVAPGPHGITHIVVDNRLGDVRVEGHDGDGVVIHAFKRGPDDAALDRLKVSLVPDPQGPVRIGTRLAVGPEFSPLPAGAVRLDLVIEAPRKATVQATVWNGRLAVVSMDNGADLQANRGDVEVKNCSGRIVTSIAVGRQQFEEVVGDIEAQGLRGDLDLQVVRGQHLDAMVHRGHVVGRKIRARNVSIRVTHGNITFTGAILDGGEYSFATYHGDVEVGFAQGPPVRVAAQSRSGDVKLPAILRPATQSDGWVTGEYHHAGAAANIHMVTAVGAIRVSTF